MSVIKLKHFWMKRRNLVIGRTIFSFNEEGIASVEEKGNVRDDINLLLAKYPGKVQVIQDTRGFELPELITTLESHIVRHKPAAVKPTPTPTPTLAKPIPAPAKPATISQDELEQRMRKMMNGELPIPILENREQKEEITPEDIIKPPVRRGRKPKLVK